MVCEGITKNPASVPGEGARAIDTFHADYIANQQWIQAENSVREHQHKSLSDGFDYFGECALMLAFLTGYAPEMPLRVANDIVTKLIKERRNMK